MKELRFKDLNGILVVVKNKIVKKKIEILFEIQGIEVLYD